MIEILLEAERALEMGRIDVAETLYRQVAESDPRNSIAVVGLARVTLERGDELGAYLQARRALAIDPENAAASRMVQRLEEVMRYRGDPVPKADPDPDLAPRVEAAPTAGGLTANPTPRAPDPTPTATSAPTPGAPTATESTAPAEPAPAAEPPPVVPGAHKPKPKRRSLIGRILDVFRRP